MSERKKSALKSLKLLVLLFVMSISMFVMLPSAHAAVCSTDEIIDLLDDYEAAFRDKDSSSMSSLLADDFLYVVVRDFSSSRQYTWNKSSFLSWISSTSSSPYNDLSIYNRQIQMVHQEVYPSTNQVLVSAEIYYLDSYTWYSRALFTLEKVDSVCKIVFEIDNQHYSSLYY